MEVEKIKESLEGYNKQLDIIVRKRDAMSKAREVVKKGMRKVSPVYEYEKDDEYWAIERELYDCKIDQELLNYKKEITTLQDMINNLEDKVNRMEGEKNE